MDKKRKGEAETGQPASQPAQAGPQAGHPSDAAGLQAGLGRTPTSRRRPPGRPRPAPGPDPHHFVLDYK